MRLENKVCVITGASAGMGRATAELFVNEGANVVAVARRESLLKELCERCKDAPGEITYFAGDIGNPTVAEGMIAKTVETFGYLDFIANVAGIMDDSAAVGDFDDQMMGRVFATNVYGVLYSMRAAIRQFLKQGNGGSILNIASVGAFHQTAGVTYCASKAAVVAATRNTAFMYMDEGIHVNSISPGGVMTDIAFALPPQNEFGKERTSSLLMHSGEMALPEDLANAILFFATDDSRFVNGVDMPVDGGWTCF